eukprot:5179097-Amphidinium_carterae.1
MGAFGPWLVSSGLPLLDSVESKVEVDALSNFGGSNSMDKMQTTKTKILAGVPLPFRVSMPLRILDHSLHLLTHGSSAPMNRGALREVENQETA